MPSNHLSNHARILRSLDGESSFEFFQARDKASVTARLRGSRAEEPPRRAITGCSRLKLAADARATHRFAKGFGYVVFQFALPFRIGLNRQAAIVRSFSFVYEPNLNVKIDITLGVGHRAGAGAATGLHDLILFVMTFGNKVLNKDLNANLCRVVYLQLDGARGVCELPCACGGGRRDHGHLRAEALRPLRHRLARLPRVLAAALVGASLATAGAVFQAELNGPVPGSSYDQLQVNGGVNLNGATLNLQPGFSATPGTAFLILVNEGSNPVQGTFAGLPEGAIFQAGGQYFSISYEAGSGNNDVVVTRVNPPGNFSNVTWLNASTVLLQGLGGSNLTYTIQANTNLSTTNWVNIGTAPANGLGLFFFSDTNASSYPQRFFRTLAP